MIPLYVGYDPREALIYHVFCQSVIQNSSVPVNFTPLHQDLLHVDGQQDGTNAFIYSRYLVPYLQNYEGWAIFVDGDMIVNEDINELWKLRDESKAVMVVKHDYQTKAKRKYVGTPIENDNVDYPRKNWSSVILFNCSHPSNRRLTPDLIENAGGAFLHRFEWLSDDEIGELPKEWNWLELEYDHNPDACLYHHTLGSPGFEHYMRSPSAWDWNYYLLNSLNMEGEDPKEIVRRAKWRNNVDYRQLRNVANDGS
jgi:lipopolysaccharide biosynthesis glycosyltransferase